MLFWVLLRIAVNYYLWSKPIPFLSSNVCAEGHVTLEGNLLAFSQDVSWGPVLRRQNQLLEVPAPGSRVLLLQSLLISFSSFMPLALQVRRREHVFGCFIGKSKDVGERPMEVKSSSVASWAVWSWAGCLSSFTFFLIYKMGSISLPYEMAVRIESRYLSLCNTYSTRWIFFSHSASFYS